MHPPARLLLLLVTILFCARPARAQDLLHLDLGDRRIEAHVVHVDKPLKTMDSLTYHWYKDQRLHVTQGGAGDVVLDGPYKEFYPDGQLMTSGTFRQGLKHGEWLDWGPDGKLSRSETWRKGLLRAPRTARTKPDKAKKKEKEPEERSPDGERKAEPERKPKKARQERAKD